MSSNFVIDFLSPQNRDKTKLTVVEKCPWWVSLIIFVLFLFILILSIVILGVCKFFLKFI